MSMRQSLEVHGLINALYTPADFVSKTTEELKDRYNPNPSFYQEIVDKGIVETFCKDSVTLPSPDEIGVPWDMEGFLYFYEGCAYLIDYDYDGYTRIKNPHKELKSLDDLLAFLEPINVLIALSHRVGINEGRRQKIQEVRKALSFDD